MCCGVPEKMFGTLVVLAILYSSEMWGLETTSNDSESFKYTYIHMKFIKGILVVYYKATNTV